jgi:NADH:ubiquinone oxidoreductase subunit E
MIAKKKKKPAACACGQEPSEKELMRRLDEMIAGYKDKPGALIPVLQLAQGIFGYLPVPVLKRISAALDLPYSEVAGVVGFYAFFSTKPRGKHLVRVCLGTACYVRGGKAVLESFKKELGVDVGDTTKDKLFTLEVVRCIGACGLGPAVMVGETIHQWVRPKKVRGILETYREGAPVAAKEA